MRFNIGSKFFYRVQMARTKKIVNDTMVVKEEKCLTLVEWYVMCATCMDGNSISV